ncbi:MAG: hypothetical protein AABO58_00355 [Acidobacteriota bacterium]
MRIAKTIAAAALTLVLAAACGSTGIGDILGGGGTTSNQNYDISGTVDSVDLNSRSIYLTNVSGYTANLMGTGGNTARVYYDDQTTVTYQGKTYRPQDLERGDQVRIRAGESGNQLIAESMDVTYNARGGMTSSSGSTIPSGSSIHGTVRSIDTYNRTITVDRGFGSNVVITYNANTPVYFNNKTYSVTNLEVGDEIDIRTSDLGSNRIGAQDITVTRNASGNTSSPSSSTSTIRGTVRSIDTYNRTISLDSASWISGFKSSTSGNTMTVQYDTNTRVDYQGQLHPITNLERGDVVDVQVTGTGSSPFAQRIILVRDVNN